MEIENNVVEQTVPVVNPLDELGVAIEEFKLKIKAMFDESAVLSRKVKEVALNQKQKKRDFIQARRAIMHLHGDLRILLILLFDCQKENIVRIFITSHGLF